MGPSYIVLNNREDRVLGIHRSFLGAVREAWHYAQVRRVYADVALRRGLAFGVIVQGPRRSATIATIEWNA